MSLLDATDVLFAEFREFPQPRYYELDVIEYEVEANYDYDEDDDKGDGLNWVRENSRIDRFGSAIYDRYHTDPVAANSGHIPTVAMITVEGISNEKTLYATQLFADLGTYALHKAHILALLDKHEYEYETREYERNGEKSTKCLTADYLALADV